MDLVYVIHLFVPSVSDWIVKETQKVPLRAVLASLVSPCKQPLCPWSWGILLLRFRRKKMLHFHLGTT